MSNYSKHDIDSETLAMALLKAVVNARKARNLAVLGILSVSCIACSGQMRLPSSEGRILIDADAKGMQAFYDGNNGLISNGKASADIESAHWKLRKKQEVEVTKREFSPSFWDKLTGEVVAPPPETNKEASE